MVRINIELPDELHKELKIDAIHKKQPLKDYLVELLQKARKRGEEK